MPCMNRETLDFEELVERAMEGLPPEFSDLLDNVVVMVEDWPDHSTLQSYGEDTLYGLYEGIPLTERGSNYSGVMPDTITIFRGPLERDFARNALVDQVRITVVHEIAHHFGFDEDRLEELGWG
ncbi:MAG: metallopeptidase family protein [Rubrobacter sp.]|nr:metallopeptidase family protein [Rubrobacter sp.]